MICHVFYVPPPCLSCKLVAAKILYMSPSIFLNHSSPLCFFFCVSDMEYVLRELDECCLSLYMGFPPSFTSRFMAMIIGANYLVYLPQDRDSKEYSQAAPETPFVLGRFPVFSSPTCVAYFHILLVDRKYVSLPLNELTSFATWSPISLHSGLLSSSSLADGTSPLLPLPPPPVSALVWVQLA